MNLINRADKFNELQGVSEEEKLCLASLLQYGRECRVLVQILEGASGEPNVDGTEGGNDGTVQRKKSGISFRKTGGY